MNSIKKVAGLIIFFSLIFGYAAKAQFYSTGQDPASAKWEQIKTDNFQIIFQKNFRSQGQKIANILEYYYEKAGKH